MPPSPLLQESKPEEETSFLDEADVFPRNSNEHDHPPNHRFSLCCCKKSNIAAKFQFFPQGSRSGAVVNICSATLGVGVLALPYAIKSAGLVVGLLLLFGASILTICSIDWITKAMHRTGCTTYDDLTYAICGTVARYTLEFLNFVFCFGGSVAYIIAVGDILDQVIIGLMNNPPHWLNRTFIMVVFWAIAMYPLSLFEKIDALRYSSLVGLISVFYLVVAVVIHSSKDLASSSTSTWDTVNLWPENFWDVVRACPLIMFAYSCQPNVASIFTELGEHNNDDDDKNEEAHVSSKDERHPSDVTSSTTSFSASLHSSLNETTTPTTSLSDSNNPNDEGNAKLKAMRCVTRSAIIMVLTFYTLVGVFGYVNFGNYTMPNVLKNYCIHDTKNVMMIIAFVGIAVAIVMGFPLNVFPARTTLSGVLRRMEKTKYWKKLRSCSGCGRRVGVDESGEENIDEEMLDEPLLSPGNTGTNSTESNGAHNTTTSEIEAPSSSSISSPAQPQPAPKSSKLRHVVLTTLISGSALGVAIAVPNIKFVLGLMGGVASSFIAFIFPALFARDAHLRSLEGGNTSKIRDCCRISFIWFVIAVGVVVGVMSTGITIYDVAHPEKIPSECSKTNPHHNDLHSYLNFMVWDTQG
mmetsp:Transcript_5513/g.8140  ORF Transcript_5513/g.8140 Transcript_5513/m.8140 type:complete len:637 (+) Transcript_5513:225-2135(+)